MTINEYQMGALRTVQTNLDAQNMLLQGVMGLAGEAGECADLLKKHLFHGHPLDSHHLAKELGDVAWYLAISAYAIGYPLECVLQMNLDKLRQRYPHGFDPYRSMHRMAGDL